MSQVLIPLTPLSRYYFINPIKRIGLKGYGLEIVENVPIEVEPNPYNMFYMKTKKERMGHDLHKIK